MKEFIEKPIGETEEKVKVTSLEIIVTGTKDKPYFQIKYKEVGNEKYNIGYGSYDLNYVLGWKEECFEIVNQLAQEYNNEAVKGDLISKKAVITELNGIYLDNPWDDKEDILEKAIGIVDNFSAPYQPKGE